LEKVVDRVKDATVAGNRKWVSPYRRVGVFGVFGVMPDTILLVILR
jgi:hypothetical protein